MHAIAKGFSEMMERQVGFIKAYAAKELQNAAPPAVPFAAYIKAKHFPAIIFAKGEVRLTD